MLSTLIEGRARRWRRIYTLCDQRSGRRFWLAKLGEQFVVISLRIILEVSLL